MQAHGRRSHPARRGPAASPAVRLVVPLVTALFILSNARPECELFPGGFAAVFPFLFAAI